MGITKRRKFDIETETVSKICKALGHPTRIQIMTLLWKKDSRTCGEIVELIPLAQSTISKHLVELKKANLVNIKNTGKKVVYSVEIESIELLQKYLTNYLSTIKIPKKNKTTILTTRNRVNVKGSRLKQYNYQFPNKINTVNP